MTFTVTVTVARDHDVPLLTGPPGRVRWPTALGLPDRSAIRVRLAFKFAAMPLILRNLNLLRPHWQD
jgi:hypothetical protein